MLASAVVSAFRMPPPPSLRQVYPVDLQPVSDQDHVEVRSGERAGAGVTDLAGIGLRIGDERFPVLETQLLAHEDHGRRALANRRDDRELVLEFEAQLLLHRQQAARHGARAAEQGVAVRLPARDVFHRDDAVGARLVLDDDVDAKNIAQLLGGGAQGDVGRTAGRERIDDADRLRGELVLGKARAGARSERKQGEQGSFHEPFLLLDRVAPFIWWRIPRILRMRHACGPVLPQRGCLQGQPSRKRPPYLSEPGRLTSTGS